VWKTSKAFDVFAKSTRRQLTIAPTFEDLTSEKGLSVDIVPKWETPHLFHWQGYWIDVGRDKKLGPHGTYHERLDPALVRPGRMDVKIEYKLATQQQARALFERFFFPDNASREGSLDEQTKESAARARSLADLCQVFSSAIPDGEFSTAELQGYLLTCKWDPDRAADGVGEWVASQRSERAAQQEKAAERVAKLKAKKDSD
jgi:hypothetical protein